MKVDGASLEPLAYAIVYNEGRPSHKSSVKVLDNQGPEDHGPVVSVKSDINLSD